MEVVAATPNTNGSPFHNHDVREWSRLDSLTGVLERARLETDHWSANTATASHKYNKVVDSRARSAADGNLQQQARRKLEVFQSQVPGGRIQVIKTQTVSSSRWTTNQHGNGNEFEDLKLSLNPLDLTSEKSKASVGRSVGRRPPSRSRIRDDILSRNNNLHHTAATNLHRVSRLCHQIHNTAVKQTFGSSISERQSGDGIEIVEVGNETKPHTNLTRTKSTSSDDLHDITKKSIEDLEDLEQLQNWRRTSKLRRSLQYPKQKAPTQSKPPDLPENTGSVRKIREDLETGRRLSTALRGNNVDLEALDQILKSISNSSVSTTYSDHANEEPECDESTPSKFKQKRSSFVTVESIQAVRDRLRRTSSPISDIYKPNEDTDDGIVTEDKPVSLHQLSSMTTSNESKIKPYIYGMEAKKSILGTGSLESRSKFGNLSSINRNEDWFSRRKSYGFEQMNNQQETIASKTKNRIESSTDSGICRSTEIVLVPTPTKSQSDAKSSVSESEDEPNRDESVGNVKKYALIFEKKKNDNSSQEKNSTTWLNRRTAIKDEGVGVSIPILTKEVNSLNWKQGSNEVKRHSIAVDESKYISNENKSKWNSPEEDDDSTQNKKSNKKVEFCKTEVHFAADSGRVNIVETDEKPPPTQKFRRRRRNSGPMDDYPKNGLPVLHFGDSTYEKVLFGDADTEEQQHNYEAIYENIQENNTEVACGNVTVNANGNYDFEDIEHQKENIENELPRGILKNKPMKPKPYILGDKYDLVKHLDDEATEKPWGVKLRTTQREGQQPVWKSSVTLRNSFSEQDTKSDVQPEFQKLLKQLRPTSKRGDSPFEINENKDSLRVLSPSIDTRRSSWSVADRIKQVEELKWTENKGYSTKVNFGNGEATVVENRHPTWPRKEEQTKDAFNTPITAMPKSIYLTDIKTELLNKGLVVRIGRSDSNTTHTVCSKTMTNSNTNGTTTTTKITIDLTPSPTEKDKNFKFPRATIQSFKSPTLIMNTIKNDNSEGKIKISPQLEVLRKLYEDVQSDTEADKEVHRILMQSDEKDECGSVLSGSWSKMRAFKHVNNYQKSLLTNGSHAHIEKDSSHSSPSYHFNENKQALNEKVDSLSLNKDASQVKVKYTLQPTFNDSAKLSSPYLVEQNRSRKSSYNSDHDSDARHKSPMAFLRNRSPIKEHVLRQPKKSEMAYFGVNLAANRMVKKELNGLSEKPDLLQFNTTIEDKKSPSNMKKYTPKSSTPIYENIVERKRNSFDSSILDELTKAADQILQAVNGYGEDDHYYKFDREDEPQKHEKLETISETKSWNKSASNNVKSSSKITVGSTARIRATSSNSSLDSITRECRKPSATTTTTVRNTTKSYEQKQRKKIDPTIKATTKARRLQRASSREALLQSHGSSSEDLTAHVEVVRKQRLVKKAKTTQLTISNGIELKKPGVSRRDDIKNKHEERVPVIGLPEIRHKTAVSTIRSTAEKAASRERARLRNEENKKKQSTKKDLTKGISSSKPERMRTAVNRDPSHRHTSVNLQKKTNRVNEGVTKH